MSFPPCVVRLLRAAHGMCPAYARRRKGQTELADQGQRCCQSLSIRRVVEPAALARRMRQRDHDRRVATVLAHTTPRATRAAKTRDPKLVQRDAHLRLPDPGRG